MKEAVNFLTHIYHDSITDVAAIKVAEADNDKVTIEKYLITVRDYTEKLINKLNDKQK